MAFRLCCAHFLNEKLLPVWMESSCCLINNLIIWPLFLVFSHSESLKLLTQTPSGCIIFPLINRWPWRSLSTITVEWAPPSTATSTSFWWWETPGSSESTHTTPTPDWLKTQRGLHVAFSVVVLCVVSLCWVTWITVKLPLLSICCFAGKTKETGCFCVSLLLCLFATQRV